jgi:hypothetical protein
VTVIELRRYALHPGERETLIELFDRELVEPQEAVGMRVLGQFRDLDDPDSFVWLRGFENMTARRDALAAFYGGPVWREHRDAANATMIDSDNVLLLQPAMSASGLELDPRRRPPPGTETAPAGVITATICSLRPAKAAAFPELFERELADADVIAAFRTEHSPNDFPALPVREGVETFVWLSRTGDVARLDMADHLAEPPEILRLTPTSRSLVR